MSIDFAPRFSKHALERLVYRFPECFSEDAIGAFSAGDSRALSEEAVVLYSEGDCREDGRNTISVCGDIVFMGIPDPRSARVWVKTVLFKEWVIAA